MRLHVRALVGARVGSCGCGHACGRVYLRARVWGCACVHACAFLGKGCGAHVRTRVSTRGRASEDAHVGLRICVCVSVCARLRVRARVRACAYAQVLYVRDRLFNYF